MYNIIRTTK